MPLEIETMVETPTCPRCGAELSPGAAPEGLCPRCLLAEGLGESAASSASSPGGAGAATPLASGSPRGGPHGTPTVSVAPGGKSSLAAARTAAPRFVPPEPSELAPLFPQLEIIEVLGQGGMGVVYKARQPRLDRLVAVKILPRDVSGDPTFAERFTREARALAKLSHSSVVTVHDFGLAGDLYYFIMEYVDGVNLRQMIQSRELKPEQALSIVPQVCDALQYAHNEGVVHRDIKPENILIDRRGRVKIADFGLAKLLGRAPSDHTLTGPTHVMGTPLYMAPEQLTNPLEVDHRADIYSLGVVFYEMLTGELPIGRFAPPSEKAHVDARLDEVVFRSLEKEPARRFQHVSEVKSRVESIVASAPSGTGGSNGAAGEGPPASSAALMDGPGRGKPSRGRRRKMWLLVGLLVTGMMGLLLLVFAFLGLRVEVDESGKDVRNLDPSAWIAELIRKDSYEEGDRIWNEIQEIGKVDDVIAALKTRLEAEPENPDLHVHLGIGYGMKLRSPGAGEVDKGRLAMLADASFDRALKIDPRHWQARFSKALFFCFWPPIWGKQGEAKRLFEGLIKDQKDMPPKPDFAQPYLFLGNLHLQQGNGEKALAVWKEGAALYPDDPDLKSQIQAEGSP